MVLLVIVAMDGHCCVNSILKKYCRHLTHSSWIQYYLLSTGIRLWFGQLVDSSFSTGTGLCFGQLVVSPFSTWTTLWFGQLVDSSFGTWTRLWLGQLVVSPFSTWTTLWFGQLVDSSFNTGLDYGLDSWQVSFWYVAQCPNCPCGPLRVLGALSMGGKVGAMCSWPQTSILKCQL